MDLSYFGIKKYPVTWFSFDLGSGNINLGVCEKTKKIAFLNIPNGTINDTAPIIIQDVLVGDTCDDRNWCLCSNCEFCNITQKKALKQKLQDYWDNLSEEQKQEINCKKLDELINHFIRRIKEFQKIIDDFEYAHDGGIIIF